MCYMYVFLEVRKQCYYNGDLYLIVFFGIGKFE